MPVLDQFINTRDPFLNFRWSAYQFPFGLDPRYVEKVSVPWPRFESIPIYGQGTNSYYHSVRDIDAITVTFYEDVDLTITKMLLTWRDLIQKDGYYGLPVDYKKDLGFYLLAPNSSTAMIQITAQGAWPSAVDNMELAYDSSDRLIISVTFTIDSLIITPLDTNSDFNSRVQAFTNNSEMPSSRYTGSNSSISSDVRAMLGLNADNSNTSMITDVSTDNNGWSISTNGKTSVNDSGWTNQDSAISGYRADENNNTSIGFSFRTGTTQINAGSVVIESYDTDVTNGDE